MQGYKCVPYYQCEKGKVVTDGAGLFDIRSAFPVLDPAKSKCQGDIEICCQMPKSKKPKIRPTTTTTPGFIGIPILQVLYILTRDWVLPTPNTG